MIKAKEVNKLISKGKISLDRTASVRKRQEAIQLENSIEILEYLIFCDEVEHLIKLSAIQRICQLQLQNINQAEDILCKVAKDCKVLEYKVLAVEYIKSITSLHNIRFSCQDIFFVSIITMRMDDIHLSEKLFVHNVSNKSIVMAHMEKYRLPGSLEELSTMFEDDNDIVDKAFYLISQLYHNFNSKYDRFYSDENLIKRIAKISTTSKSSKVKIRATLFLHNLRNVYSKYEHILTCTVLNSDDYIVRAGLLSDLNKNELNYVLTTDSKAYVRRKAASLTKNKEFIKFALFQEKNILNKIYFCWCLVFN